MKSESTNTALTEHDLKVFETLGYLQLDGFLDSRDVDNLKVEVDEHVHARAAGKQPMIVSSPGLAMLTSHPRMMTLLQQLMQGRYSMHHIHAARHDAGQASVLWHQDYEQNPQRDRNLLMVHVFYYLNGLNGTIGDLLLRPGSQKSVIARNALRIFGTEDLPGSLTVDALKPGAAIVVHSALFHARRAKTGGDSSPRYFIDISYCQHGIKWPGYTNMPAINAKALELGAGRNGEYDWVFDTGHFLF